MHTCMIFQMQCFGLRLMGKIPIWKQNGMRDQTIPLGTLLFRPVCNKRIEFLHLSIMK